MVLLVANPTQITVKLGCRFFDRSQLCVTLVAIIALVLWNGPICFAFVCLIIGGRIINNLPLVVASTMPIDALSFVLFGNCELVTHLALIVVAFSVEPLAVSNFIIGRFFCLVPDLFLSILADET